MSFNTLVHGVVIKAFLLRVGVSQHLASVRLAQRKAGSPSGQIGRGVGPARPSVGHGVKAEVELLGLGVAPDGAAIEAVGDDLLDGKIFDAHRGGGWWRSALRGRGSGKRRRLGRRSSWGVGEVVLVGETIHVHRIEAGLDEIALGTVEGVLRKVRRECGFVAGRDESVLEQ